MNSYVIESPSSRAGSMHGAYSSIKYYPFQIEGIRFALDHARCLIADEMGLGKGVQAVGVLNHDTFITSVLIICPKSLITNWHYTLDTFMLPERREYLKGRIKVTNYERLAHVEEEFHTVIVDESHYVKSSTQLGQISARALQVQRLCANARRVIFLSGTPMPNRPIELWSSFMILDPQMWGTTEKDMHRFAVRYCDATMKVFDFSDRARRARAAGLRVGMGWDYSGASNLEELNEKLFSSFCIRREKSEVLPELPPKTRELVLTPLKEDDYDLMPELIPGDENSESEYENIVAKLKTDRVQFTEWSKRRHSQGLEKVDFAAEYIARRLEASPKIIVFAHHEDVIANLSHALRSEHKVEHVILTGKMTLDQRARAVYNFQEHQTCRVIIGSLHAMGVGLTLTAASHVIFTELDPVPGIMSQAEDRAHRIGQKQNVFIEYLVTDGSLDARICKILVKKLNVIGRVFNTEGRVER